MKPHDATEAKFLSQLEYRLLTPTSLSRHPSCWEQPRQLHAVPELIVFLVACTPFFAAVTEWAAELRIVA